MNARALAVVLLAAAPLLAGDAPETDPFLAAALTLECGRAFLRPRAPMPSPG